MIYYEYCAIVNATIDFFSENLFLVMFFIIIIMSKATMSLLCLILRFKMQAVRLWEKKVQFISNL